MSVLIKFDDYEMNDVSEWDENIETRINETSVPRRHGTYHEDTFKYGSRKISLRGTIFSPSWSASREILRDMKQRLSGGVKRLYFDDDEYIMAAMQHFSHQHSAGRKQGAVVDFAISFICKDPFYYSVDDTTTQDTFMVNNDSIVVINGGNIETFPLITVNNGSFSTTNLKITNTHPDINQYVQYTGTIIATEDLVIDHSSATMEKNSVSVLNDFSGDFFGLGVGSNTLLVSYTGSGSLGITVQHTDRRI